jgi:hypothetical protein
MTSEVQQPLTSAQRASRYRSRQRRGVRVVPVSLNDRELDALVELGHLEPGERSDRRAVQRALRGYVNQRLMKDVPPVWSDDTE